MVFLQSDASGPRKLEKSLIMAMHLMDFVFKDLCLHQPNRQPYCRTGRVRNLGTLQLGVKVQVKDLQIGLSQRRNGTFIQVQRLMHLEFELHKKVSRPFSFRNGIDIVGNHASRMG